MADAPFRNEGLCAMILVGDLAGAAELLSAGGRQRAPFDLNAPCDPTAPQPSSPLHLALTRDLPEMVGLILGQSDLELNRSLPAHGRWRWVRTASLKTLRIVLDHPGLDPNQTDRSGRTALHEAAESGSDSTRAVCLLEHGAHADPRQDDGTTPLYRAALTGNFPTVQILLRRSVDVNNRNTDNLWTVLMVAVAWNHPEIVRELLLRTELDINACSERGETALHLAAGRGFAALVGLLLERPDLRLNAKNASGWTPLIQAAFNGHVEVVKLLCQRTDLALNAVDQDRQTALHWAVLAGRTEVVRLLLGRPDINVNLTNRPLMKTAQDLARERGLEPIVSLLQRASPAPRDDELSPGDVYVPRPPANPAPQRIKPWVPEPPRKEV